MSAVYFAVLCLYVFGTSNTLEVTDTQTGAVYALESVRIRDFDDSGARVVINGGAFRTNRTITLPITLTGRYEMAITGQSFFDRVRGHQRGTITFRFDLEGGPEMLQGGW